MLRYQQWCWKLGNHCNLCCLLKPQSWTQSTHGHLQCCGKAGRVSLSCQQVSKDCLIAFLFFLLTMLWNFSHGVQCEFAWGSHQHCIMHVWPDQSCCEYWSWIHLTIPDTCVNKIDFLIEHCEILLISSFWILLCYCSSIVFPAYLSLFK